MSVVPDAAVGFLLGYLDEIVKYNYNLVKDVDGDIKELQKELRYLESLMKDFTNYNHDSEFVKTLVKDIKAIIDDAEDVVDTYVLRAAVQKSQPWLSQKFHFIDYSLKLRDVGKNFHDISERIKKIYEGKAKNAFEILKTIGKPSKTAKPKEDPNVEEEHVVGFDGAIKEVSGRLTGGSEQLEVISIVGMLGLGKTTLAKKVFNHPDVDFEYMIRVFVYVSREYERREVFLKILRSFTKIDDEVNRMPDDELKQHLCKKLEGKQYLIVLDDVWEKDDWDSLKGAFPINNKKRCRVLITTRHEKVAEHAKNSNTLPYKLDFLPDDKSQELLRWKVFRDNNFRRDIDKYEEQIAKKCDGLPLAIVVIAGIISNHADRVEWWKHVSDCVEEYMVRDHTTEVIELMYKHLPNRLKLCFIYLGVFPEDFEIPVWKLVRLWIAEGLIRESPLNWEDNAEEHLDELVYRNLVIVGQRRANGKIKTCTVHDALREFCKNQAKEENLFQEIKKDNLSFLTGKSDLDQHRRLCIHNANVVDFISSPPPGKCIRSLLTFAKEETAVERKNVSKIPKTFRLLRVLEIQALKFPLFPIDINCLVLLKYIAISSKFESLPETMTTLWNMQTLIVKTESPTLEIKADIWKMPQLRHLHTNTSTILPCLDSKNQKKKNEVLRDQKIQTLSTIAPESCTTEILGRTGKLKKLGIRGRLTKLFGETSLFDNLKDLAFLENLKLVSDNFDDPPIANLPSKKSFPPQLTILSLNGTQLDWKEMAKLGKLVNLEILKLKEHAFKGKKWQTAKGGFLKLKHLHIGTTDLEDWEASADHFPYLKCLELHGCDKLKAVPAGFSDISSLQSVDLRCTNTEVVSSAKTVQAQKDKKSPNFILSVYPPTQLKDNPRL